MAWGDWSFRYDTEPVVGADGTDHARGHSPDGDLPSRDKGGQIYFHDGGFLCAVS